VRVSTTDHFYPVRGRTVERIAESLEHDGPVMEGNHAFAWTTWRVGWGGRSTMTAGVCHLTDIRVNVAVEMILPRWLDHEDANRMVQIRWQSFETAVRDHESGHRALALKAGAELLETLRMVSTRSCEEVTETASASARSVLERYRKADRAYDRTTVRGANRGAYWPPPPEDS
jgi:predicted secreted Zn-dependent protease